MNSQAKIVKRELVIRLTRLPDIDSPKAASDHGLLRYGRFALTRAGSFWFAHERSSHPPTTLTGWYWAIATDGTLLVSARGSALDGEALFGSKAPALAKLIERLVSERIIPKPASIRCEGR
ncbi:hypothetical protein MASR2M29_07700 [Spirochaetota bacterium]